MIVRKIVRVQGRVQGVGYRYFAVGAARSLGLRGVVANLSDGCVEAVVEGEEEVVRAFLDRLREGPPASRVSDLMVRDEKPRGDYEGFEIVHRR